MTTEEERPELKLSSHVLIQLGSELVTDVEQAILECVKNAYDADSFGCTIDIDTRETGTLTELDTADRLARFSDKAENVKASVAPLPGGADAVPMVERKLHWTGSIVIEDTGEGLTAQQLRTSWLVISGSGKRSEAGTPKTKTGKGRTPLGDKGLGRLGTMRLGDILKVESATATEAPLSAAWFRWADCRTAATIDQIPVRLGTFPNPTRFKGTKVTVLGLNDMAEWNRPKRLSEITGSLMRLISPFEATSRFRVSVTLNGAKQSLASLTEEVLNKAIARYDFDWTVNGATGTPELRMAARFKKGLFTPTRRGLTRDKAERSFIPDDGAGYFEFLARYGRMKKYDSQNVDTKGEWLLTIKRARTWTELMQKDKASVVDPGPFKGAFYYFFLDNLGNDTPEPDAEVAQPTDRYLIKAMAGISVLRDGFRVRSQGDWLDLAAGMTTGSTYQMRVSNTVGYFALTGEDNYRLTEKSDREGFVEDAAYRGFMQIARACKEFANDSLEDVRRGFDAYDSQKPGEATLTTASSLKAIDRSMDASRAAREKVAVASKALQRQMDDLKIVGSDPAAARSIAAKALSVTLEAIKAFDEVRDSLAPAPRSEDAVYRLRLAIDEGQEQVSSLFESAAIGLSARGLAHELRTHLGEIRLRTVALEKRAKKSGDRESQDDIRAIRGACTEILKAAALIDPMLPRGRSKKEEIDLLEFVESYMAARESMLGRLGIRGVVTTEGRSGKVTLNSARLNQVLDNLVRNSMYWLRNGPADGTAETPDPDKRIVVEVGPSGFVVWDNGPGVDVRYEESLFDIFVTAKPDREPGQGLGLFIVRNLLQSDGCDIALLPERNVHGRRYKFSVNTGAASSR